MTEIFITTAFEILLVESSSVLEPAQRGIGSESVKYLKLITQENFTLISHMFFIALSIKKIFFLNLKININKKPLICSGAYDTSLDATPLLKSLSIHCRQINS